MHCFTYSQPQPAHVEVSQSHPVPDASLPRVADPHQGVRVCVCVKCACSACASPIRCLSQRTLRFLSSTPSSVTLPSPGSYSRSSRCSSVDLPQPDAPTSATVRPSGTEKLTPSRTCSREPGSSGSA